MCSHLSALGICGPWEHLGVGSLEEEGILQCSLVLPPGHLQTPPKGLREGEAAQAGEKRAAVYSIEESMALLS